MNISGVRYFLAVCKHGSFTAAAEACGVRQPSVTSGVHRLERAVRGKLFERRRPIQLTPLGASLLPLFEGIQSLADRVASLAEEQPATPGEVVLGRSSDRPFAEGG